MNYIEMLTISLKRYKRNNNKGLHKSKKSKKANKSSSQDNNKTHNKENPIRNNR